MHNFLNLLSEGSSAEFEKCGDVIISPKDNLCALFCHFCKSIFMRLPEFVLHLQSAHSDVLAFTKERNVYTVEELMEEVEADAQSLAVGITSGDLSLPVENKDAAPDADIVVNILEALAALDEHDKSAAAFETAAPAITETVPELSTTERNRYTGKKLPCYRSATTIVATSETAISEERDILSEVEAMLFQDEENVVPGQLDLDLQHSEAEAMSSKDQIIFDAWLQACKQGPEPRNQILDETQLLSDTLHFPVETKGMSNNNLLEQPSDDAKPAPTMATKSDVINGNNGHGPVPITTESPVKSSYCKINCTEEQLQMLDAKRPSINIKKRQKDAQKSQRTLNFKSKTIQRNRDIMQHMSNVKKRIMHSLENDAKRIPFKSVNAKLGAKVLKNSGKLMPQQKIKEEKLVQDGASNVEQRVPKVLQAEHKRNLSENNDKGNQLAFDFLNNKIPLQAKRNPNVQIMNVEVLPRLNVTPDNSTDLDRFLKSIKSERISLEHQEKLTENNSKADPTADSTLISNKSSIQDNKAEIAKSAMLTSTPLPGTKKVQTQDYNAFEMIANKLPKSITMRRSNQKLISNYVASIKEEPNGSTKMLEQNTAEFAKRKIPIKSAIDSKQTKMEKDSRNSLDFGLSKSQLEFLQSDLKTSQIDPDSILNFAEEKSECNDDAFLFEDILHQVKQEQSKEPPRPKPNKPQLKMDCKSNAMLPPSMTKNIDKINPKQKDEPAGPPKLNIDGQNAKKDCPETATVAKSDNKAEKTCDDIGLLKIVGLTIIKVPNYEDNMLLEELYAVHKLADKFAKIMCQFVVTWNAKYLTPKTIPQIHEGLVKLTHSTNIAFDSNLSVVELKHIFNMITFWYTNQIDKKLCNKKTLPPTFEHYINLFAFMPTIRRRYYCEYCVECFSTEIRYFKHRDTHVNQV